MTGTRVRAWGRWLVVGVTIVTVLFTAVMVTAAFQRAGDTQRVIDRIDNANATTLENRRNGYKTRALLCAELILDGVDIEVVPPCQEPGIDEFLDADLISSVYRGQVASACAVIRDLGAVLPPECQVAAP